MKPLHAMALAVLAIGSVATAQGLQVDQHAHQPVPVKGEGPQAVPVPPPPQYPPFESLAKKGPDGKVVRLQTVLDLEAFQRNSLIKPEQFESLKPAILNWLADVDQLAIDNLDFLEKLNPVEGAKGLLDNVDVEDKVQLTQMAQMMTQLMSAGPLTAHLETKGLLTREQSGFNQQITSEYLQQCMNELQLMPVPPELAGNAEKAKTWRVNHLTKFLYKVSCNDTMTSYRRMMADAAPNIDAIVGSLGLDAKTSAKVEAQISSVRNAKDREAQRTAVRSLMENLSFEQKRQFLTKARELAPIKDPIPSSVS